MGREVYMGLYDEVNKQILEESYVCGRDEATNLIAERVYWQANQLGEDFKYEDDDESGYVHNPEISLNYNIVDMNQSLEGLLEALEDMCHRIDKLVSIDEQEIADVRLARQHAPTLDEFNKFSEYLNMLRDHQEDLKCDNAYHIYQTLSYLKKTVEGLAPEFHKNYTIYVTLSE